MILETFINFRIHKLRPLTPLSKNTGDLTLSATMPVLKSFILSHTGFDFVSKLNSKYSTRFILERLGVKKEEILSSELSKDTILQKSKELALADNSEFITTIDILVAYLLLTEPQSKLLFQKELKEKELLQILSWARLYTQNEHNPKPIYHHIQSGLGDGLLTGWTPETQNFIRDVTYSAYYNNPQLTGRDEEFKMMNEALGKAENNNILLVGDPGSGKENLVDLLALNSQSNSLSGELNDKRVAELLIGPILAGASDKGELETRIEAIVQEISHAGNIILYIPEFQNILGSSSYSLDLSGALLPHLKSGSMPIIATMTKGNYKTYFERNPLKEAFEIITLSEPTPEMALEMVFHKVASIESKFKVIITYKAALEAVQFADRYFQDDALPGSAITLLEDVANNIAMSRELPNFSSSGKKLITPTILTSFVQDKTHIAVAAPNAKEKELLLNLEAKLHERVIDQNEAISAISESIRRLRSGLASNKKPISFLFLGPTGVGKTETAKALGDIYFGGEENILRLDMSEYTDSDGVKRLLGAPPGEGEERGELTDKIHDHPASLVLLDEFEKANPRIRDLFLQVLEDGRLTDNKGRTVSFLNSIIIATSNAGSEFIREELGKGVESDKAFQRKLLDQLQEKNIFTPELLNRFEDVIVFKPLGQDVVKAIVQQILKKMTTTLEEQDISIQFDDSVISKIATEGQDIQFGARPLLRYIQDNIEDKIAQEKLKDKIVRGDKIILTLDQEGQLVITKQ